MWKAQAALDSLLTLACSTYTLSVCEGRLVFCCAGQEMGLNQPSEALQQCLELHLLSLLPAVALGRLSCTCRAVGDWLSHPQTARLWHSAASKHLAAPYLLFDGDVSHADLLLLLQQEAEVHRQLENGTCIAVRPVGHSALHLQAHSEDCFIGYAYALGFGHDNSTEEYLCSIQTGCVLGKATVTQPRDARIKARQVIILDRQPDNTVLLRIFDRPDMTERMHLTLQEPQVAWKGIQAGKLSSCTKFACRECVQGADILTVIVHDLSDGRIVSSAENARLHAWHPAEPFLAISRNEHDVKQLQVCSAPSGEVLLIVPGHFRGSVRGDRWSPCGQWLACCQLTALREGSPDRARRLQILCACSGRMLWQSQLCDDRHHVIFGIKFTCNGHMAVISKQTDRTPHQLEVIDVKQGSILSHFIRRGPSSDHTLLGFCPRGLFIAISDSFEYITLYNAASGWQHAYWHVPSMAESQDLEGQESVSIASTQYKVQPTTAQMAFGLHKANA